jgi:hypothetical protein
MERYRAHHKGRKGRASDSVVVESRKALPVVKALLFGLGPKCSRTISQDQTVIGSSELTLVLGCFVRMDQHNLLAPPAVVLQLSPFSLFR